jgi:ferritin-like metal-binding protein YciE
MGFFSKDIKTMDDLFVHTLRDIYYAERQIVQALPDMIEKAHDAQLKQGFETHSARDGKSRQTVGKSLSDARYGTARCRLPGH